MTHRWCDARLLYGSRINIGGAPHRGRRAAGMNPQCSRSSYNLKSLIESARGARMGEGWLAAVNARIITCDHLGRHRLGQDPRC